MAAAAVVACACAVAAPGVASAQCGPPKGVVVANAELQNALYLFLGQTGNDPSTLVPNAAALAGALAAYPPALLDGLREPPQCRARRGHARRTSRASAARRR